MICYIISCRGACTCAAAPRGLEDGGADNGGTISVGGDVGESIVLNQDTLPLKTPSGLHLHLLTSQESSLSFRTCWKAASAPLAAVCIHLCRLCFSKLCKVLCKIVFFYDNSTLLKLDKYKKKRSKGKCITLFVVVFFIF